jgi:hypothetical protein
MNRRLKHHLIWNAVMPGAGSIALEFINWANPDLFEFNKQEKSDKKTT